ncbi:MAG: hypothetical protein CM15mV10_0570 [uncultured marine virus]|nr:MAG: hypothetical protein CM15mV10_0570 [uncultured marine virus]
MEMRNLLSEPNSSVAWVSMVRLLGWLYVGDDDVSLNEKMIDEGYAWAYDGDKTEKF